MKILVLNSGSSSVKSQLFIEENKVFKAHIDGIGLSACKITTEVKGHTKEDNIDCSDHTQAIEKILDSIIKSSIIKSLEEIDAIGHRVVHGGEKYKDSVMIDGQVIKNIDDFSQFAPLHNPPNLLGIKACQKALPGKPQVAVFDTSFHSSIPKHRYVYAIPYKFYERYKIRKYGFHGTSFKYIAQKAVELLGADRKVIICHIGNGSSICAVKDGKSIDTSMGFTPLQGLIMGTRSGDIDPSIVKEIEKRENLKGEEVLDILNKKSGLKGLCNDSDMRNIWKRVNNGDDMAASALEALTESITKYISYYLSLLGGADAIIFTAGLGENAYYLREKVLKHFDYTNIRIDKEKNNNNEQIISTPDSSVKVMVIPTDEELMIAKETQKIVENS